MDRDLAAVAGELVAIVEAAPQELAWVKRWESQDELVADLRDHADRLGRGDMSRLDELVFLFAPTGPLQTIAIDSGWPDQYMDLASRFDRARPSRQVPP